MAHSNLLGGDFIAVQPRGTGTEALGTSGNSDSGSDIVGTLSREELLSDSDATGTGERADVERDDAASASDIRPDHLSGGVDAGDDALDAHARTVSLDDARDEIDSLASADDAAPGDENGDDTDTGADLDEGGTA